jgi:predicted nucleotidyltransferase
MVDLDEIARQLAAVFARREELDFLWLFGSVAEGRARPGSDIDLAVHVSRPAEFSFFKKLELHGDCCRVLKRSDVDLVVLNQTRNLLLAEQALRQGRLLFCRNQAVLDDFYLRTLHAAIDFREQRRRIMGV